MTKYHIEITKSHTRYFYLMCLGDLYTHNTHIYVSKIYIYTSEDKQHESNVILFDQSSSVLQSFDETD